jgi:hypothetical protein
VAEILVGWILETQSQAESAKDHSKLAEKGDAG